MVDNKYYTYYTPEEVHYMDNGVFTMGTDEMRTKVAIALSKVPKKVVEALMEKCFIMDMPIGDSAEYLPNELIKNRSLIVLGSDGMDEKTILHEVAHFCLKHESPLLWALEICGDDKRDMARYEKQEKDAWDLVKHWLEIYQQA